MKSREKSYREEEGKIRWREADRISDFQGKYFPKIKNYKKGLKIIICIFIIGIILQIMGLIINTNLPHLIIKFVDC